MKKEIIKLEFPFKLEELLNYTFNFDNLIKAISFLHNNSIKLFSEINDINKHIAVFESMKSDIEEMKITTKNIQNQNDALNQSMKNMQERMLKFDGSLNELNKKVKDNETKIEEHNTFIESHDKNLSHLNKVVEDNVKKIGKLDEEVSASRKEMAIINEEMQKLKAKDKDLEDLIFSKTDLLNSKIIDNKNDIETLDNSVSTINSFYNVLKNKMEAKNKEFETMIKNLTGGIGDKIINFNFKSSEENKEGGGEGQGEGENKENQNMGLLIKTINDNNFLRTKINDIEEDIKNFKALVDSNEEKMNKSVDKNKGNIENIKNNLEQLNNNLEIITKEVREEKEDPLKRLDLTKYVTKDVFKKASDNIRILTSAIGTTTTREEFDNAIKKINARLQSVELIQQGVSYGTRTMINSKLVQSGADPQEMYITQMENVEAKDSLKPKSSEELKKIILFTINEEIKNINILKHPKFSEILNNMAKLEKDIGKNDSSIINIRNILAVSPTQNDLINLRQELERFSEESSKKINELFKIINGDEEDEEDEEEKKNALAGFCLNKKINILITKFNELYNKLISVQNKNNSLSREIKEEVKQNLKMETLKVVEEFKSKLDSFTYKFENELRSKIDHSGLSVFEDKMSSRFRIDLKEKLDKSELKKNNYVIKRKINNLENKISKTLVDTIIDLQMDEAPLIVKTNAQNVELCASCNQALKKNFFNTDRNFSRNSEMTSLGGKKKSLKSNSNHHITLNLNMKETNSSSKNKKLPGIVSYTQSK